MNILKTLSTDSTMYSAQRVLNKILKHSNFIIFSILLKLEDEFPLVFSYYSRKVCGKFYSDKVDPFEHDY